MAQPTDQIRNSAPDGAGSVTRAAVGEVLAAMAAHLTTRRPAEPLNPVALQACVAGEVYNAGGRTSRTNGAPLSAAVTNVLPSSEPACTRAEYAVRLYEEAADHGWDGERAIPTIPAPRPAPKATPKPAPPARRRGVPGPRPATGRAGR